MFTLTIFVLYVAGFIGTFCFMVLMNACNSGLTTVLDKLGFPQRLWCVFWPVYWILWVPYKLMKG